MRVGIGFDVHPFTSEIPLFLGGIKIDSDLGLKGHSDADVLIHALIDALLGAMGEGDIGSLFPDSDPKYKNIRSSKLLDTVVDIMFNNNYKLINADLILLAEKPKIKKYNNKIEENLSKILKVNKTQINLKATTTEGLGFIGRVEGIGAQAVVLLENK
ncbi:MAG TPA: 2-C-methyl-D-erythritol 2,4-cyclodiphosphate synthase [Halanaerobiales bacterium]|nr:2-C-methyl-D-erythritol 2,4-cyclodiphosphate synthase [Halanaerobiales bacterium]